MQIQGDLNVKHLSLNTQLHPNELGGLEFLLNSCSLMEKLTLNLGTGVIFEVSESNILYILCIYVIWFDLSTFLHVAGL